MSEDMAKKKSRTLSTRLYLWTRQLHLYLGLFVCPFILVFAISTMLLDHSWRPKPREQKTTVPVQIPEGLERKQRIESILQQLDLTGEIIGRGNVRNNKMVFRVARPGKTRIITVDMVNKTAQIVERSRGLLGTLIYLHFNPGPHKLPNWFFTKVWGMVADTAVYVTLFLSISGIYMWAVIKAERKIGLVLLGAGCLFFVCIMYTLLYA